MGDIMVGIDAMVIDTFQKNIEYKVFVLRLVSIWNEGFRISFLDY